MRENWTHIFQSPIIPWSLSPNLTLIWSKFSIWQPFWLSKAGLNFYFETPALHALGWECFVMEIAAWKLSPFLQSPIIPWSLSPNLTVIGYKLAIWQSFWISRAGLNFYFETPILHDLGWECFVMEIAAWKLNPFLQSPIIPWSLSPNLSLII